MSKASGVISCLTRPDQPLGPQNLHPKGAGSVPTRPRLVGLCGAVAWSAAAYGAARATPVRGRCVAGPRPICVGGVRGVTWEPRSTAGAWLGSILVASGAVAGRVSAALYEVVTGAWRPRPQLPRHPHSHGGPGDRGALLVAVVSALDGVGGVMVARPAVTCLGSC
jgi:hypothetical protein